MAGPVKADAPALQILNGTWLISFADLITLLVCAFLMFFSLSWTKASRGGTQIAQQEVTALNPASTERGFFLRFVTEDLTRDGRTLSPESLEKIKSVMTEGGYENAVLSFAVCNGVQGEDVEQHVLRQLIDTVVPVDRIKTLLTTPSCEEIAALEFRKDIRVLVWFERS